jgi:very-short-patch-repair endonuclease
MRVRRGIIRRQKIDPVKLERAQELRRNMTFAERRLWHRLRTNKLDGFHFRRQQIIDGFIVDFYCHAAGLVVELDGAIHDKQVEYDTERERVLEARGLRILRFRNEEVLMDIESVLTRIRAACWAGMDDPSPCPPSLGGKGEPSAKSDLPSKPGSPPLSGEGTGEGSS